MPMQQRRKEQPSRLHHRLQNKPRHNDSSSTDTSITHDQPNDKRPPSPVCQRDPSTLQPWAIITTTTMASSASSTMSTLTNSNRTMTTFAPSTPKRQSSTALTPRTTPSQIDRSQQGSLKPSSVTPNTTPGRWTHPRYDEVLHRQNARTFTDQRAKQILYNSAALAVTFFLTSVVIPAQWIQAVAPDMPGFYNALSWTSMPSFNLYIYIYL